jgi:hypothetical protein
VDYADGYERDIANTIHSHMHQRHLHLGSKFLLFAEISLNKSLIACEHFKVMTQIFIATISINVIENFHRRCRHCIDFFLPARLVEFSFREFCGMSRLNFTSNIIKSDGKKSFKLLLMHAHKKGVGKME